MPQLGMDRMNEISRDDAAPQTESRDANQMGGFAKGIAVIEAFGNGRKPMTIAEVARIAGLDRASTRRCVFTLVAGGYARCDGRVYELTPKILRLGSSYLSASLPKLIRPSLERLADQFPEVSCSASVLDGDEIIYIARAAHHRLIGIGLHVGSRMPTYCTAMGRVLLAALPQEKARAILAGSERRALTERTLTQIDDLLAELETVRRNGYSIIFQEVDYGACGIAVPVLNISGNVVAAMNIAMQASPEAVAYMKTELLPRLMEIQHYLATILP